MHKILFFFGILLISSFSFSQNDDTQDSNEVAFAVIEKVPVYPGCTANSNIELKNCMSQKIQEHFIENFDMTKANSIGLSDGRQQISVNFKIDREGYVVNVRARGPHPILEKEAVRVVESLPRMEPGEQKGEAVGVLYALPILFVHEDKPESKGQKRRRLRKERKKNINEPF